MRIKRNHVLLLILSILSSVLYGISDELHQYFVPGRNAEWMDIFADIFGSVFGAFIYQFIKEKLIGNRFKFTD